MNPKPVRGFELTLLLVTVAGLGGIAAGLLALRPGELAAAASGSSVDISMPQERGVRPPTTASSALPTTPAAPAEPLIYGGDSGQAASANGMIAVTGSYGVGTSVLYVLDTVSRQLAVYEARGGSPGGRRLVLVGARRIDLDLQIEGYNDDSEFSYRQLAKRFERLEATEGTTSGGESGGESGSGTRGK